jgi:hypothetical protein
MSGVHRTSRRAQKTELQRSKSNSFGDVAGAPDMPVCTGLSGAPSNRQPHQTASLVVGAINTPNHPPFIAIQVFQLPTTIQELAFITKHTKRDQILPTPHKALVTRESDL